MTAMFERGAEDALYIIDLSCWVYRFVATTGTNAHYHFTEFIKKIVRDQEPAHVAVCCDMRFPTFRHELAPRGDGTGYKEHRPPPDPNVLEQMRFSRELLIDYFGFKVYAKKGFEADDIIATLTKRAVEDGMRVCILGLDKDLSQLVTQDGRVIMWDGKRTVFGWEETEAKFGVRPDQVRDYLAIVGDNSDNVPGIHGAGPKAALEILREFQTLDYALQVARSTYSSRLLTQKPRYRELLRKNIEQVRLSMKLVTLADVPDITFDRTELRCDP